MLVLSTTGDKEKRGRTYDFILNFSLCFILFCFSEGLFYLSMVKILIWYSKYLITRNEACRVDVGYYRTSENPNIDG